MKKAALHNLGCKVNAYETEAMQELLEKNGYEIVPFHDLADVYVINTCSVTNMADRKSRQMIHRARKQNPDAVIVAAGCYVQAQADMGELDENIDIVIGNNKKKDLIRLLEEYFKEDIPEQMQEVIDINHTFEYESLHLSRTAEHTRAYLKVQDGCNQFCTYCIIPYARGRVRSRKKEDVVEEVRTLAEHGYQEVVLTGIHLSSYGLEWKDENGKQTEGLLDLIRAVHGVEGIKRIRLGSLEPRIVTEEFAKELFGPETKTKFRPHHFPFTEPSAEVDVSCFKCGGKGCRFCKGSGWIEILGCGMVHPHVLEMCGIDPKEYTGFAFGVGLERIALLKYEIDDMRLLYENDYRFLKQF